MPVIKPFSPRATEIQQLEQLLNQLTDQQNAIKTKVLQDLKSIRLGDKGEQNAAYMLGEMHRDHDAVLINGLRLVVADQTAQIDHLSINRFGIVSLYETKNFSTGLKVDKKGVFWRWDAYQKSYIDIPSPLKQSERHEAVLKKVLAELGFVETAFRHFVIVDYQARLIKPEKGFENVCRPDRIQDARAESNTGITVGTVFKALSKLALGKTFSPDELVSLGQKLMAYHQPITFDYAKKYGLTATAVAEGEPEYSTESNHAKTFYTHAQLAKNLAMTNEQLEAALFDLGWFEERGKFTYLTEQGKQQGIVFRKTKQGNYYFLYPQSFTKQMSSSQ